MKRSDKILLIFFLSALGIFGAAHLALYAKYSQGKIMTDNEFGTGRLVIQKDSLPAVLYLQGNLNVRILASDTFSIQWQKDKADDIDFHRSGDSLLISGKGRGWRDPHRQWLDFQDFPWVSVYCGQLKKISLYRLSAMVRGEKTPGHEVGIGTDRGSGLEIGTDRGRSINIGLDITESQLALGDFDPPRGDPTPGKVFYDSIGIRAVNSNLSIFRNTVLHSLYLQMDDNTELHEYDAQIDKPDIRYSDHSQLSLSGANLRKLK